MSDQLQDMRKRIVPVDQMDGQIDHIEQNKLEEGILGDLPSFLHEIQTTELQIDQKMRD